MRFIAGDRVMEGTCLDSGENAARRRDFRAPRLPARSRVVPPTALEPVYCCEPKKTLSAIPEEGPAK